MLIVVPICARDLPLACFNLQLVSRLDSKCPFACLLSAPEGLDLSALEPLASRYFASVSTYCYTDWRGDPAWPRPQNWAWQAAARHVATLSPAPDCWFWWEADATPLKAGVFSTLYEAYKAGGKPFAGQLVGRSGPKQQTSGVALYPPDVRPYSPNAFLARSNPFDCVLASDVAALVHPITDLIGHYFKPAGRTSFAATPESIESLLSSSLVMYHGSRDGSLVRALLASPPGPARKPIAPRLDATPTSPVTVVITSFRRPKMLWEAYQSCRRAKVANIVVTTAGATSEIKGVLAKIHKDCPSTHISTRDDDDGCNATWLRGAQLVRTPQMTILHDDDLLLPAYEFVVSGKFSSDVIHWDGAKHGPSGPISGVYVTREDLPEGVHPIPYLLSLLLAPNSFTLSPVSGCFPTEHVLAVLDESSKLGPWAWLRPTMLIGNDLLLWLRAAQKYRTVHYTHQPCVSYGHWNGSVTFDDVSHHRMKLLPIYKAARRYFLDSCSSLLHVVPRYVPRQPATVARIASAAATWSIGYENGLVLPRYQWSWSRDSSSVGDSKQSPFLRDVLESALASAAKPSDLIVLTNDDTLINQYFWFAAFDWLKARGAGCSFRRNLTAAPQMDPRRFPSNPPPGTAHCGRDAFFFTQDWLRAHLPEIPDYLLGFGDWDSTLAMLIRLAAGVHPKPADFIREDPASELHSQFIYHTDHEAPWTLSPNQPGMVHNRSLTTEFFAKHMGWPMPKLRGKW